MDPNASVNPQSGGSPGPGWATPSIGLYSPFGSEPPQIPDHEMLRRIGRGAFGEVWLGRTVMGTYRAVKIVHRHAFEHPKPYEREFEGIRRFEPVSRRHESQVAVLHVGRNDAVGYFYYVMELADATGPGPEPTAEQTQGAVERTHDNRVIDPEYYRPRTLRYELHDRGRMTVRETLRIGLSLTTALEHLHSCGLVHRDIKPSNIIFINGVAKLADLGLVSTLDASMSVVGTPGFIPPEGAGLPAGDIYSLGKVLYEMSTGEDRTTFPRLPPDLMRSPEGGPLQELNVVLVKACQGKPEDRYHSAAEMHADLALIRSGKSVKRLRWLERHLTVVKRVAAGALAVSVLVAGAWWQTWRLRRTANEHLTRSRVESGAQLLKQGDYLAAMPWLVGALRLEPGGVEHEKTHRMRLAAVLAQSPRPIGVFAVPDDQVLDADLSADGSRLVTAHDKGWARLWDTASERLLQEFSHHDIPPHFCRFMFRDNWVLTSTFVREALLWDPSSAETPRWVLPHFNTVGPGPIYIAGVNRDTRRAYLSLGTFTGALTNRFTGDLTNLTLRLGATGEGENVKVRYQVRDRSAGGRLVGEGEFVDTPGVDLLAYGRETDPAPVKGRVWVVLYALAWPDNEEQESGRAVFEEIRARSYPTRAQQPPPWEVWEDFSEATSSGRVLFNDLSSGEPRFENGHLVFEFARRPQGFIGVACRNPLAIRDGETLEIEADLLEASGSACAVELALVQPLLLNSVPPWDPVVSRDGNWLALQSQAGLIQIWDLAADRFLTMQHERGETPLKLRHRDLVAEVDLSSDGRFLVAVTVGEGEVAVWKLETGRRVPTGEPAARGIHSARFSPDGRFLVLSGGRGLSVMRVEDWQMAASPLDPGAIDDINFSPIGQRLAGVHDQRAVLIWDLSALKAPPLKLDHEFLVQRIAFSPDGRYLASSTENGYVRLWSTVTGADIGPRLPGELVRFSADGSALLLKRPGHGAWLWDFAHTTPRTLAVPPVPAFEPTAASPDNTMTAITTSKDVVVQRVRTRLGPLSHLLPVRRAWFDASNRYLVSETSDLRAWIWDIASGTLVAPPATTRYEAGAPGYPPVDLPAVSWDDQTLTDFATVLSGLQPDGKGALNSVPVETMQDLFRRLKGTFPREFSRSVAAQERWHLRQAEDCERQGEWAGAVFHWRRVVDLHASSAAEITLQLHEPGVREPASGIGNDASEGRRVRAQSRLAYARLAAEGLHQHILAGYSALSFVPPRPSWAGTDLLDLTELYSQSLLENVAPAERENSFGQLTSGVQTLGGVEFDVRGVIEVRTGPPLRIPIHRRGQRIHFLHAAKEALGSRQTALTTQVTFDSGERVQVGMVCPSDLLPYRTTTFHSLFSGLDVYSTPELHMVVAWAGTNAEVASRHQTLYLSRTTWDLPKTLAENQIQILEIHAASDQITPLVFAITVE